MTSQSYHKNRHDEERERFIIIKMTGTSVIHRVGGRSREDGVLRLTEHFNPIGPRDRGLMYIP